MKMSKASRNSAISAKCRDCIYDSEAAGTWRQQVTACPSTGCALWRFRPLAGGIARSFSSRSPDILPEGWRQLSQTKAVMSLEPQKRPIDEKSIDDCASDIQKIAQDNWMPSFPASCEVEKGC